MKAAGKISAGIGRPLSRKERKKAGLWVHYGFGLLSASSPRRLHVHGLPDVPTTMVPLPALERQIWVGFRCSPGQSGRDAGNIRCPASRGASIQSNSRWSRRKSTWLRRTIGSPLVVPLSIVFGSKGLARSMSKICAFRLFLPGSSAV
jgi:hypothetical protein